MQMQDGTAGLVCQVLSMVGFSCWQMLAGWSASLALEPWLPSGMFSGVRSSNTRNDARRGRVCLFRSF
jgi:hypothetical protein